METIRAKFKCDFIKEMMGSKKDENDKWVPTKMKSISMSPVYSNGDPNHENSKFWSATPSGTLELSIIPIEVSGQFEVGKEYYIDITPAK